MARLARALVTLVTVLSLFTSVIFAGQSYLFCSMLERAVDECCCSADHPTKRPAVGQASSCCHVNEHAIPGNATGTPPTPAVDAHAVVTSSAPLAIVSLADVAHVHALRLPDWNGPPLPERRAKLQVFLL